MEIEDNLEENTAEEESETPNQGKVVTNNAKDKHETNIKENYLKFEIPSLNKSEVQDEIVGKIKDKFLKHQKVEETDLEPHLQIQMKEEQSMFGIKKEEFDRIREARKYKIISRKIDPGANRFVCLMCGKREKYTDSIKTHLSKYHDYVEPPHQKIIHECNKCVFTSGQIIDVVRHMAKVHSSTELYSRCHLCDYQSEASFGVKHHIKITHFKMIEKCEQCEFTAARQNEIRKHVKTVHEGIPAKCSSCSFTSLSISNIYSHRQRYHTEKSCKVCHAKFKGTINLVEHKLRQHEGKVIDCMKCDYKSTNKLKLQKHMKYAHPFKCSQCQYETTGMCDLQTHLVRVHTMTHRKSRLEIGTLASVNEKMVKIEFNCDKKDNFKGNSVFEFFGKQIKFETQPKREPESFDFKGNILANQCIDPSVSEFEGENVKIEKIDESREKEGETEESENNWNWEDTKLI